MHAGATLSRRFTLLRPHSYDLPGVDRWVAHDERRAVDVHVDLLTSAAPGAVRQAAVRAAQVRDLRFARVLATGRESLGGERVTYIVTETPRALPLTAVAHQRIVPPAVAAAIIGEAAYALETAAKAGVTHGFLRPEALHLVDSGRVVISGLGVDGHLATQAGVSEGRSQRADARALARLYVTLVTGLGEEHVTVADLPEDLSPRAADLARSAIAGRAPTRLAAIARALSPSDARVLRDLSQALGNWPWAPGAEPVPEPTPAPLGLTISFSADTLERATALAGLAAVGLPATPDLTHTVASGQVASRAAAREAAAAQAAELPSRVPVSAEDAAQFSSRTQRAVARQRHQELGLDTWETIAAEQNRTTPPSVVQAVLEWLHGLWPRSVSLGTAAQQARHRARQPGPLKTGPVLVSMFVAITLVAGIVAFEILTSPANPDGDLGVDPPSHYPQFTFSPEPLPTESPETEANGDEDGEGQSQDDTEDDG